MTLDFTLFVVVLVYLGMVLGNYPGFSFNRPSIALFGAILLIVVQNIPLKTVSLGIDYPTLCILFGLMVMSAHFYYAGLYHQVIERLNGSKANPSHLLLLVIVTSAVFSAFLINDIVCLVMTPIVIKMCYTKRLKPVPFLLGLSCASNIGSAFTLIGNPQNILIGQVANIPLLKYMYHASMPSLLGCVVLWKLIAWQMKGKWRKEPDFHLEKGEKIKLDSYLILKGLVVFAVMMILMLFTSIPRDHVILGAAGVLLISKRITSRKIFHFVNWQLLVLFIGLFIVNHELLKTNILQEGIDVLAQHNIKIQSPTCLFFVSIILGNLVSNVPSVMLLLPFIGGSESLGTLLALSSTLSGNLFILGSVANFIVFSESKDLGVNITWKDHFKVGFPVTIISLGIAVFWLYLTTNII